MGHKATFFVYLTPQSHVTDKQMKNLIKNLLIDILIAKGAFTDAQQATTQHATIFYSTLFHFTDRRLRKNHL